MFKFFYPSQESDTIVSITSAKLSGRNEKILHRLAWPTAEVRENGVIAVAFEHMPEEDFSVLADLGDKIVDALQKVFAVEACHHHREADGHDVPPKALVHIYGLGTFEEGFDLDGVEFGVDTEDGFFIRGDNGAGVYIGMPYVDESLSPLDPSEPETIEVYVRVWHEALVFRGNTEA